MKIKICFTLTKENITNLYHFSNYFNHIHTPISTYLQYSYLYTEGEKLNKNLELIPRIQWIEMHGYSSSCIMYPSMSLFHILYLYQYATILH